MLKLIDINRTKVPHTAMAFSDVPFPYGPFVPHHIPRQYIESYFSAHHVDGLVQFNTTVEDLSKYQEKQGQERWKLTLRNMIP
jgi:cation diffusion facilitator CzcD-associated flavoprotein CzcO